MKTLIITLFTILLTSAICSAQQVSDKYLLIVNKGFDKPTYIIVTDDDKEYTTDSAYYHKTKKGDKVNSKKVKFMKKVNDKSPLIKDRINGKAGGQQDTCKSLKVTTRWDNSITTDTSYFLCDTMNRGSFYGKPYIMPENIYKGSAGVVTEIGQIKNQFVLYVGSLNTTASSFWGGLVGHTQIVKFTDISQSNVNSTTLTTAYNRGKLLQGEWLGGSPIEVAFYDWKGADITEVLRDKSGTGNNLTGTNITIDDRVKVKNKFK